MLLLSPGQFEQLSELEQMDLPTIALVISTKKMKRSGENFTDLARRFGGNGTI